VKLSQLRPCDACGEPIGVAFFRILIEQHVVDMRAVRQRVGLATMFGGGAQAEGLASVFDGDGEDGTQLVGPGRHVILCNTCFCSSREIAAPWQKQGEQEDAKETT
jgi:hypothetical protein